MLSKSQGQKEKHGMGNFKQNLVHIYYILFLFIMILQRLLILSKGCRSLEEHDLLKFPKLLMTCITLAQITLLSSASKVIP